MGGLEALRGEGVLIDNLFSPDLDIRKDHDSGLERFCHYDRSSQASSPLENGSLLFQPRPQVKKHTFFAVFSSRYLCLSRIFFLIVHY